LKDRAVASAVNWITKFGIAARQLTSTLIGNSVIIRRQHRLLMLISWAPKQQQKHYNRIRLGEFRDYDVVGFL
jgi:hypothetical protein